MRPAPIAPEPSVRFEDRVAATALALLEGASPQLVDGLRASSLDERAVERLRVLPLGRAVEEVLHDCGAWPRSVMRVVIAVIVLLIGVGSAALVSSAGAVSVPAVIVGTLGVQTVLLLAWLLALVPGVGALLRSLMARLLTGPVRSLDRWGRGAIKSLGTPESVTAWLARWRRGAERDHAVTAASVEALSMAYAPRQGVLAALVYGAWSNAAWLAANGLMLVVLAVQLLRSRNYTLHSGLISPELSLEWTESVVRVLTLVMPASMLPDAEAMSRAALEPTGVAADSWRWGTMLLATLVAFGVLPRLLGLLLSLALLPIARRRWRMPWDDARLAATRGVIDASAPPVKVVARERPIDGDEAARGLGHRAATSIAHGAGSTAEDAVDNAAPTQRAGPESVGATRPALLHVGEARIAGIEITDLGVLTQGGLADAESLAARVAQGRFDPLILACALTTAPRRGIADLLEPIVQASRGGVVAVLSEAARIRRGARPSDLEVLLHAWRRVLEECGVKRVLEIDGSLPSPRSAAQVAALLTGHQVVPAPAGLLGVALSATVDAADDWGDRDPSGGDERRLIDRLGKIHGIDALSTVAPFIASLEQAPSKAREAATQAIGAFERSTGLATMEERARAADRRRVALASAVQLAVELELQGCGEALISRSVERARRAWDEGGHAPRSRADRVLASMAEGVRA